MKVIFFQLSQAAIKDAAPDIYVFTFNSLKVRIVAWRMENTIFIFHLSLSLSLSDTTIKIFTTITSNDSCYKTGY